MISCGNCTHGQMYSFTGALVDCNVCGGSGVLFSSTQDDHDKDKLILQLQQQVTNLRSSYGDMSAMIEEKNVEISRLNAILNERILNSLRAKEASHDQAI